MGIQAYYFYHKYRPLVKEGKPTGVIVFEKNYRHLFGYIKLLKKHKYFNMEDEDSDITWVRFPQMDKYYNNNEHIMNFNNDKNMSNIIEECKKYFNSDIFDVRIFLNDLIANDERKFNLQMEKRIGMTFKTAIGYCNKKLYNKNITEEEQDFLSLAIASLHRRVPQPVKKYILTEFKDAKTIDYVCPMCNRVIQTTYNDYVKPNTLFCQSCGQALDWNEQNG